MTASVARRTAWLVPTGLYALAASLYIAVALLSPGPGSADAAFYASAGEAIASGRFAVDFLWSFNEVGAVIPDVPQLPVEIGGHWLPGAALTAAPFIWLFGPAWPVPALGAALIAAIGAPVAWRLGRDLGLPPTLAIVAGVLTAIAGPLLPFLAQPDNHSLSLGLGSLGLLLAGRAALGSGTALVAAGAVTGAMLLARNDAVLYLLPLVAAAVLGRRKLSRSATLAAALAVAVFVVPWWAHQLLAFGTISPSAAGGRSLWILDLADFNRLGRIGPDHLFARGLTVIVASRLSGLLNSVILHALFIGVGGLLLPFTLYAAVIRRRERLLVPTLVFALAFFGAAVLLFAAHVPNGMYIRSGAALLPASVVLGLVGVVRLRERLRPSLRQRATVLTIGTIGVAQIVLALSVIARSSDAWRSRAADWAWVRDTLDAVAQPGDRIQTYDAASAFWHTGRPAVNTPNDPPATLHDVARAYGLDWLVVMRGETIEPTLALLDGGTLDWVSPPVAQLVDAAGTPRVAVYAIGSP